MVGDRISDRQRLHCIKNEAKLKRAKDIRDIFDMEKRLKALKLQFQK